MGDASNTATSAPNAQVYGALVVAQAVDFATVPLAREDPFGDRVLDRMRADTPVTCAPC